MRKVIPVDVIVGRYESIGFLRDIVGEKLAAQAAAQRDRIDAIRVYRRVR